MSRTRSRPKITPRNSLEAGMFKELKKKVPKGSRIEYETERLPYTVTHEYVPDFIIKYPNGYVVYIEVKGYLRPQDRVKMIAVKKANPTLDIRFLFAANNKLHSGSKSRYGDWCDKHGFEWAVGFVPEDWFN